MSRGVVSMLSARSARSTPQQPPWGGDPRHAWYEGVLARVGGGDCQSGWGRLPAVGNAVGAGVGVGVGSRFRHGAPVLPFESGVAAKGRPVGQGWDERLCRSSPRKCAARGDAFDRTRERGGGGFGHDAMV